MSIRRHHRMVCFDDGRDRFQMRAAGLAVRDGRVLVQNVRGDPTRTIPGGRIDQNESSVETVIREIEEEFGRRVEVGPLAYVVEAFFPDKGQRFHEVSFFFRIDVPNDFPYHETEVCHRFQEGPVEIEYSWVSVMPEALAAANLHPVALQSRLHDMPAAAEHIVERVAAIGGRAGGVPVTTRLPRIGRPATQALAVINVTDLDQVVHLSEKELLSLHGVGPKAVGILKAALAARGLSLRR